MFGAERVDSFLIGACFLSACSVPITVAQTVTADSAQEAEQKAKEVIAVGEDRLYIGSLRDNISVQKSGGIAASS